MVIGFDDDRRRRSNGKGYGVHGEKEEERLTSCLGRGERWQLA